MTNKHIVVKSSVNECNVLSKFKKLFSMFLTQK